MSKNRSDFKNNGFVFTLLIIVLGNFSALAQPIKGDFNGDGYSDIAIGVPTEIVGGYLAAGGVNVIYGTSTGLNSIDNQYWHHNQPGISGTASDYTNFGFAVSSGDFNGDGYSDLAIGAPRDDVFGAINAGSVTVLYGSATGLVSENNQRLYQGAFVQTNFTQGLAELDDNYGFSLVTGDFNNDGYSDLVVGTPLDNLGTISNKAVVDAGGVNVLYGSELGLTAENNQYWHQNKQYIIGISQFGDRFGDSFAVGDFNADGIQDLAIGVTGENYFTVQNAGAVQILFGSPSGLVAIGNQYIQQQQNPSVLALPSTIKVYLNNKLQIAGMANYNDAFGHKIAAGDLNGDGVDDLAITSYGYESVTAASDAGIVNILYGIQGKGLGNQNEQLLHENLAGLGGSIANEKFGAALVIADFNNDSYDDIAIGVPYKNNLPIGHKAGAVHVLHGSISGVDLGASQYWAHETLDAPLNELSYTPLLGYSLAVGDFDGNDHMDLIIGIPKEDVLPGGGVCGWEGAIISLYAKKNGLRKNGLQYWHQSSEDILGEIQTNMLVELAGGVIGFTCQEQFGYSISSQ